MFISPELRTMSVVPRWSIVRTVKEDSVANHSFYVSLYATDIARLIDWKGSVSALLYLALTHDLGELITGDLVSPVKKEILDDERTEDFIHLKMSERLPYIWQQIAAYRDALHPELLSEVDVIIKVADRLDAVLYLIGETRIGNSFTTPLIETALARLKLAWYDLPDVDRDLDQLWATEVLPAIKAHEITGGSGLI